jgi:hypothetical protein
MNRSDIKHLRWIYDRLTVVHREDRSLDYMVKFGTIINEHEATMEKTDLPKRYKLELPGTIDIEDVETAAYFIGRGISELCIETYPDFDIPKSWLVEITEEKPMTAVAWVANTPLDNPNEQHESYGIRAFKAGEDTSELKHKETESFEEWWEKQIYNEGIDMDEEENKRLLAWCIDTWLAANNSRGYE